MDFKSNTTQMRLLKGLLILGCAFVILFVILVCPVYNSIRKKQAIEALRVTHATLLQANKMYSLVTDEDMGKYNTGMPINQFAETYFTPYLDINTYCKLGSQTGCWKSPQYKDLKNKGQYNKSLYSIVLANKSVIGFHKNKEGLMTIIMDINGSVGVNKLGRDVFVFYVYNNENPPKICDEKIYKEFHIQNGLHLGGYDKCGIPHDVYDYKDLISKDFYESCNKKAVTDEFGVGSGAACAALLNKSDWMMDKNYPW